MATPMISPLKRLWPDAAITWLVEPGLADLVRHNPQINDVILWPKAEWIKFFKHGNFIKLYKSIKAFKSELRKRKFDLAIDAVGLVKSRFLLWLSGAKYKIGFDSKEPGSFLLDKKIVKIKNDPSMSSEYRQMVLELGGDPGTFSPSIVLPLSAFAVANTTLSQAGVSRRYAVFAPFTTRPQKHWFVERWAELAKEFYNKFNLDIVFLGGAADIEHGMNIVHSCDVPVINLIGKTSLLISETIISESAIVVGVDTGLTHIGTAFSRPTIAIFGSTRPYLVTPSSATTVIYKKIDCSPCRRNPTCDGFFYCMKNVTPNDIIDVAKNILKIG